jgi:hypothetical protein
MRSRGGGVAFSWSWAVFFGGFVWFFYRKMYMWGAFLILVPVVLAVLYPSLSSYSFASFAVFSKHLYISTAIGRILKADELGLTGAERSDYLQRAGGVSLTAGIITGVLAIACTIFAILAAYGAYLDATPLRNGSAVCFVCLHHTEFVHTWLWNCKMPEQLEQ